MGLNAFMHKTRVACTDESQDDLGRNRKLPTELLAAARPRSRAVAVLKHREPLRSEMGETYDM